MSDLAGRIAIVTGGGSGIGAATGKLLVGRGATVVLVSDRPTSETDVVRDETGAAESAQCDVSDEAAVTALVGDIAARHGRIDILVNSAGIFAARTLDEMPLADAERIMRVNYGGTYNMVRAVLPFMRAAGRGAIVNVASVAATFTPARTTAYAASKGAVVSFTRALVPELAHAGIRINAVLPGGVRTPMAGGLHTADSEEGRAALAAHAARMPSPHGRALIEPEDIAELILFLASDAARAVHGAAIQIDDGNSSARV